MLSAFRAAAVQLPLRICAGLVFGAAAIVISIHCGAAQAAPADTRPADGGWCVDEGGNGGSISCAYDNFLSCVVAALRAGGSCVERSKLTTAGTDGGPPARPSRAGPAPRRNAQTPAAHHTAAPRKTTLSAADREKLFREFIRWDQQRSAQ
jgi:hypothetical protein